MQMQTEPAQCTKKKMFPLFLLSFLELFSPACDTDSVSDSTSYSTAAAPQTRKDLKVNKVLISFNDFSGHLF